MSDAISFRPMTEADLDAVLKIEYAAFSHPGPVASSAKA